MHKSSHTTLGSILLMAAIAGCGTTDTTSVEPEPIIKLRAAVPTADQLLIKTPRSNPPDGVQAIIGSYPYLLDTVIGLGTDMNEGIESIFVYVEQSRALPPNLVTDTRAELGPWD